MYPEWIMLLTAAALSARITRLVTRDTITEPARALATRIHPGLGIFVECPWCIGWWVCIAVHVVVYTAWPDATGSISEIIVWVAAACAVNLIYATVANVIGRISDMAVTTEIAMLKRSDGLWGYGEESPTR